MDFFSYQFLRPLLSVAFEIAWPQHWACWRIWHFVHGSPSIRYGTKNIWACGQLLFGFMYPRKLTWLYYCLLVGQGKSLNHWLMQLFYEVMLTGLHIVDCEPHCKDQVFRVWVSNGIDSGNQHSLLPWTIFNNSWESLILARLL